MTATRATELEVIDYPRKRVHSSVDGIRLVGFSALLALLVGFGTFARFTNEGLNADLSTATNEVPNLLTHLLTLIGTFAALVMPVSILIRGFVTGQSRRVGEALLVGVLTVALVALLSAGVDALPASRLFHALSLTVAAGGHTAPLDPYLAAWIAFAGLTGVDEERRWQSAYVISVALYCTGAFLARQGSLLALLISAILGATIAAAARYFVGIVNQRPKAEQLAEALARRNLPLLRIEQIKDSSRIAPRRYLATGIDGRALYLDVLDRDNVAAGWASQLVQSLRVQSDLAIEPDLSIESVAETRALLGLNATAAGAAVPEFLGGASCGPNAIVLTYEQQPDARLIDADPPATDAQIHQIWESISRLHGAGVAYSGLSAERIRVQPNGRVVLPVIREGRAFASDLRINLDQAQVLATTAQLVGGQRAVQLARNYLTDEELSTAVAVLQPVAMNADTRRWLKSHRSVIEEVRQEVRGVTEQPTPELYRIERFRPRAVVTLMALIVAIWLLVGEVGSIDLGTVFRDAHWRWVAPAALASVLTYFAAAWSLLGCVREKLPFLRTALAQLAASFTGFVTPPAVGGLALNVRYLSKSGLPTPAAATSVALSQVINALLHALLLTIFAAATGSSADHSLPIPGWAFIVLAFLAALVAVAFAVPASRRWFLEKIGPTLQDIGPRLLDLFSRPRKLGQALSGALLLNAAYIACLWFAVRAFNGDVNIISAGLVYLAGAVIGSAAPTPGGLGAVEAAMSSGLIAVGMPGASAISAVLLFRIVTFWLPVPAGWVAFNLLQRSKRI